MFDCPFLADTTIDDPRFFVGRQEELQMLTERMQGSQPTSINVVGQRRTGKSSLLVHFLQTYQQRVTEPERYRVIYLSLFNAELGTEEGFYAAVARKISKDNQVTQQSSISSLLSAWKKKGSPIQESFLFTRQEFSAFIQDFKNKEILPVLCIDNFEKLLKRPDIFSNDFYDNLRYLVDNNFLMLVMASPKEINSYINEQRFTSVFFNLFHTIDLNKGLTEAEAERLIELRSATGESLSEDLKAMARRWAKTDPYLLQYAGEQLWKVKLGQKSWRDAERRFKTEADRMQKSWTVKLNRVVERERSSILDVFQRSWTWLISNPDKALKLLAFFAIPTALLLIVLDIISIAKAQEILKLIRGK